MIERIIIGYAYAVVALGLVLSIGVLASSIAHITWP